MGGRATGAGLALAMTVLTCGCAGFPLETHSPPSVPSAPSTTPVRHPSEAEVQNFEQDLEEGEPGQALTLLVSETTEKRVLDAYRRSPGADTSPGLRLGGMFYGKVFGENAAADRYYLLAGISGEDGRLAVQGSHLWTRTGGNAWKYTGVQRRDRLCIPRTVYDAWDLKTTMPHGSGHDPHCPDS